MENEKEIRLNNKIAWRRNCCAVLLSFCICVMPFIISLLINYICNMPIGRSFIYLMCNFFWWFGVMVATADEAIFHMNKQKACLLACGLVMEIIILTL